MDDLFDSDEAFELMRARHSVRSYTDARISDADAQVLMEEARRCAAESSLRIELMRDEPNAFDSTLAHYGRFSNVRNYIVLAGPKTADLNEKCGYYGERLVLLAQKLGLNTCWVALTFKKRYVRKMLKPGEKLGIIIAIGHGVSQGTPSKSKAAGRVSSFSAGARQPEWFARGVEAALLAPTAVNQQSFMITLLDDAAPSGKPLVHLASEGGAYSDVDLGIVRLHFELGAASRNFEWR